MAASGETCVRLILLSTSARDKEFPLREAVTTIGRGPENDICLDQPSVSRTHARVEKAGERYHLRDLGSRNGVKVNDQLIGEAVLKAGDVVSVGDVLLRFDAPSQAPASATVPGGGPGLPASEIPPGGGATAAAAAPAQVVATRSPEAQPVEASTAARPHEGTVRKGILLTAVLLTTIVVVVGGTAAYFAFFRQPKVLTLVLPPEKLMVNENRLVLAVRPVSVEGKTVLRRVDFKAAPILVSDPSVVRASRYEEGYLLLTGRAHGAADVTLESLFGNRILLRVIVRGRLPDPVESYAVLPASDAERRDIANGCLQTGNRLAKSDPYRALQQYRIALAVLEPMKPQGTLYVKATEKVREMETLLQQKYTELASSINKARAAKDLDQELSYLQALLQLIPDSNDPRHQKAQVRIKTAIVEMEQSLKR